METFFQDVKYAIRMLVKSPGFTIVAVVALALGIGANSAIFSVVNAILLRPLPYEEANRVVFISEWAKQVPGMSISMANFNDFRDQNRTMESIVPYNQRSWVMTGEDQPEQLRGRQTTAALFPTLRIKPIIGRPLQPEDDKVGAEKVALISEGLWIRKFARNPNILGKQLRLDGENFTVVGVLPTAGFHVTWRTTEIFTSLWRLEDQQGGENNRGNHPGIYSFARLKPGVTFEQGQADIISIAERLAKEHPQSNANQSARVQPLLDAVVGEEMRGSLMVLLGAVAFVLLIACANVANLLLARSAARQKEIAVRTALGAGRWRLVRQLLTESVLLSLLGAALGLVIAYACVQSLVSAAPANIPRVAEINLDAKVLGFTALIAILTGLFFGIFPAMQASRPALNESLKEGSRGSVGVERHRVRNALVISEMALALVLLVGAGLMLKSFANVLFADPGFNPEGVMTAVLSLPNVKYKEPEQTAAFIQQALEKVKALPGVQYAGSTTPLLGGWQSGFIVNGQPVPEPGNTPSTDITRVSPQYFQAMGVRLVKGRYFTEQDTAKSELVCIIDETFANTYWPNEDPLGKQISTRGRPGPNNPPLWMTIVGVVAHVKNYGVDQPSRVESYRPAAQSPISFLSLVVRTTGDPGSLTSSIRKAILEVDPDLPIFGEQTLATIRDESNSQRKLSVTLLGSFAGLALLLAAVGLYGVMSYSVTERTHEIGIRMALGAQARDVFKLVVGQGMMMAIIGVGIGLAGVFVMMKLWGSALNSLLFKTSATDPATYVSIPVVLAIVALLASYIPARRATRVNPTIALRYE
ncbi:MAG: ABC transporter permease [Acidobacteria bacterium]|nr:ABC transporter permease [Acidobacteriota bacterium]